MYSLIEAQKLKGTGASRVIHLRAFLQKCGLKIVNKKVIQIFTSGSQ